MKRLRLWFVLLIAMILTACQTQPEPENTEPLPQSLAEYETYLSGQTDVSLDDFQRNYDIARDLLEAGILPESTINVYDPDSLDPGQDRSFVLDGFYAVSLDPEYFDLSVFFILPEGQRRMTAEEYLQLAQAAEQAEVELEIGKNAWIALQEDQSDSTRPLSAKERFWLDFQTYEWFRQRTEGYLQPDAPVFVYVGCAQEREGFVIYPARDMSEYALQLIALHEYHKLPENEQELWHPTEQELTWQNAVAAAKEAMRTHTDRQDNPTENYVRHDSGRITDSEERNGAWLVALLYENGESYLVELNSTTGEVTSIRRMPDGLYNYAHIWEFGDRIPQGDVIYEMQ